MVYGDPVMDWELDVAEEKKTVKEWTKQGRVGGVAMSYITYRWRLRKRWERKCLIHLMGPCTDKLFVKVCHWLGGNLPHWDGTRQRCGAWVEEEGGLSFRLHLWSIYHWSDIMCHQPWPNITIWSRSGQRLPASTLKSWVSKSLSTGPKMHHKFLWVIQKYIQENIRYKCKIDNDNI